MNGLLLALFLIQGGPQNAGVVTGIVRGANGLPAAGIRVYAMAVRDATEAAIAGTALESQAQTDSSGRYRLEVAAGRYYIASGSVGAPTYYPGTTNVAAARVISIAAGGVVESIDFSSFVPASQTLGGISIIRSLPPGSTGVLQGTIRFPDGTPAPGMTVVAVPTAVAGTTVTGVRSSAGSSVPIFLVISSGRAAQVTGLVNGYIVQARTDGSGRYRLENLPPETYYIAAGFADAPVLFPGTSDTLVAKTFTTTPTTLLDALDFRVPLQAMGVRVSGRVTALGGGPAAGATVQIQSRTTATSLRPLGLPNRNLNTSVPVKADGTFEAFNVLPGTYSVEARLESVRAPARNLTVTDQPVSGLEFAIPLAMLSGRILFEDGSALPNPQVFKEAIVTTVNNPNMLLSTVSPISNDGTFTRFLAANEYRFYLGHMPDEYSIKSMTSGTQDLLQETLKTTQAAPMNIDIRVATRTGPSSTNDVKVSGSVLDSFTGLPVRAERVTLCCLESGPWERFSTPLRSDGSFEFAGVPRGRYTLGLQVRTGQPSLFPVDSRVEVADGPVSGLTFRSTPQLGQLRAAIVFENGSPLPATTPPSVVFTGSSGQVRVVAERNDAGYFASVPAGDRYTVSVTNLPEGYIVKSISGSTEVPLFTQVSATGLNAPVPVLPATAPITITLARSATEPPR